ncbi:MAG: transposase [Rhodospirillales bacterium]|nr:transposase [Rhodospirillales bacterium]
MAHRPRLSLPGHPLHVIQRGHNRQAIFTRQRDFRLYLDYLREAAEHHGLALHAYVLMTNHVHLLATPRGEASLPRTMQSLGRRYVGYFNAAQGRSGTLWEGRYRAALVDTEGYFFTCSRYVELNPVRAAMTEHPRDYAWSSYRRNAEEAQDPLISEHDVYRALGDSAGARRSSYRAHFRDAIGTADLQAIRDSTNRGWALGSEAFRSRVAMRLGRPAGPRQRGRPRKTADR